MSPAEMLARSSEWYTLLRGRPLVCRVERTPDTFDKVTYSPRDFEAFTAPYLKRPASFYGGDLEPGAIHELQGAGRGSPYATMLFRSPFPSGYTENDRVTFKWFRDADRSRRVVVMAPGWPRPDQKFEEQMAALFRKRDIDVALLTVPFHQARAPMGAYSGEGFFGSTPLWSVENFRQFVAEIRLVIRWLRRFYPSIGLLGLSTGGVFAGLASYCEDVDFYVPVGSADLNELMWASPLMRGIREQLLLNKFNKDDGDKYWAIASLGRITVPLRTPNVLQVITRFDGVVPLEFQLGFFEQLGRPEQMLLPSSQMGIATHAGLLVDRIIEFIEQRLAGEAATAEADAADAAEAVAEPQTAATPAPVAAAAAAAVAAAAASASANVPPPAAPADPDLSQWAPPVVNVAPETATEHAVDVAPEAVAEHAVDAAPEIVAEHAADVEHELVADHAIAAEPEVAAPEVARDVAASEVAAEHLAVDAAPETVVDVAPEVVAEHALDAAPEVVAEHADAAPEAAVLHAEDAAPEVVADHAPVLAPEVVAEHAVGVAPGVVADRAPDVVPSEVHVEEAQHPAQQALVSAFPVVIAAAVETAREVGSKRVIEPAAAESVGPIAVGPSGDATLPVQAAPLVETEILVEGEPVVAEVGPPAVAASEHPVLGEAELPLFNAPRDVVPAADEVLAVEGEPVAQSVPVEPVPPMQAAANVVEPEPPMQAAANVVEPEPPMQAAANVVEPEPPMQAAANVVEPQPPMQAAHHVEPAPVPQAEAGVAFTESRVESVAFAEPPPPVEPAPPFAESTTYFEPAAYAEPEPVDEAPYVAASGPRTYSVPPHVNAARVADARGIAAAAAADAAAAAGAAASAAAAAAAAAKAAADAAVAAAGAAAARASALADVAALAAAAADAQPMTNVTPPNSAPANNAGPSTNGATGSYAPPPIDVDLPRTDAPR